MTLHAQIRGQGQRLVMLHGFTQNHRCWGPFGDAAAADFETVFVDLPGHGKSRHDDADLHRAAELVGLVGEKATYIGYSLGGRVALHVALQFPHLVERLVLIGATAGIVNAAERAERSIADEAQAKYLEEVGLDEFLTTWLGLPLFSTLSAAASHRPERLTNRVDGLASSLRHCGTGTQENLWPRLHEIECPTLLMTGVDDAKFTDIAKTMCGAIPFSSVSSVSGGHSVHLESPDLTWQAVSEWLRNTEVERN